MSWLVRDGAYSEPYEAPQYCPEDGCGVLVDAYTAPEDHELICPHHPDFRADLLDELAEVDAVDTGEAA